MTGNSGIRLLNMFRSPVRTPTTSPESSPRTSTTKSTNSSPQNMSPWNNPAMSNTDHSVPSTDSTGLIGSLVRQQGHLYSLATDGDLLYTGSNSKNIRVWKNMSEFSGFKSGSGLVKSIVISGEKIFTGHQDGKIRIWMTSPDDATKYKRVGTLPKTKDLLKSSINPSSYVKVPRHRNSVWLRHSDVVSSLALDAEAGILYSGSWDKTVKAWRVSDSKCLESVIAHDDAINAVAVGFGGLVFTGSADGTVKVWKREGRGGSGVKHALMKVLIRKESAVTSLAVSEEDGVVYCGSSDGVVDFWGKGRRLVHGGVLRGHKLGVLCLVTAGRLLISGSADRTIRVWRRKGGGAHVSLTVLTGHLGPVKCLALTEREGDGGPEGRQWVLYSGSLDKSVKVWRVSEKTHVRKAQQHVLGGGRGGSGDKIRSTRSADWGCKWDRVYTDRAIEQRWR